jgi:Protein of unknown function (DUF3568)
MRRIARTARASAILAAIATAGAGAGCSTIAPAALSAVGNASSSPGFSYAAGRAYQSYALPPAKVQPALLSAVDDLRMHSVAVTQEGSNTVVQATTANNHRATIMLRPEPTGSHISVRIGMFGDEPLSRALMDRVSVRLGTLPPTAIPAEAPSEPASNPFFSRTAVPDEVMLKDQADAPYRGSAFP